ncbi:MAG: hypothetical protein ACRCT6_00930 [Notoacmeibacter sp.]
MRAIGQKLALIALVSFSILNYAFAHPLPESIVTIVPRDTKVEVKLSIPVKELILAEPKLRGLAHVEGHGPLSHDLLEVLSAYLNQHIAIVPADQSVLELKVRSAAVLVTKTEHVDRFQLLIAELEASMASDQEPFPATFTYDAVLHEVRSHRATVWIAGLNTEPTLLGKLKFLKAEKPELVIHGQ